MKKNIGNHIINKLNLQDIVYILSDKLSGSDFNTVLLDVFNKRLKKETPSSLLSKYEKNRFVKPARVELLKFKHDELKCYEILETKGFKPMELSPVVQLGTNSVVAPVDQKKIISALRGTEVMADPTNAVALHYAEQKKRKSLGCEIFNYSNISRVVRAQIFSNSNLEPHFSVLCLISCGRDNGSFSFEKEELLKHITLSHEICREVFGLENISIEVIPCKGFDRQSPLIIRTVSHVNGAQSVVNIKIAEPDKENNYYYGFRIKIRAEIKGITYVIGDGGLLNWTQELLVNKKERMMATGVGFQLLHQLTR